VTGHLLDPSADDVRIRHGGTKRFHHPEVGDLELAYQALDLPTADPGKLVLTIYTPRARHHGLTSVISSSAHRVCFISQPPVAVPRHQRGRTA
jgi:hypothetical protein